MRYFMSLRSEKGELMVLFSGVLILLLLVTGASTDFMLYSNKKDKIQEIAYLIRDTRYDLAEPLFNSSNPQKTLEEIAHMVAVQNGVDPSNIKVKWVEKKDPHAKLEPIEGEEGSMLIGKRSADTIIEIRETYDPIFLKMFNINEMPITVSIEDSLEKDTEQGYVWVPYK